jgi:thiamine pyrophosphokinase
MLFGLPENARIIQYKPYQYCSLSRKIRIVILDDHSKVFLLSKIRKMVYSKHPISLIPIGHVTGIHSENLFYALQDESLTIGYRAAATTS